MRILRSECGCLVNFRRPAAHLITLYYLKARVVLESSVDGGGVQAANVILTKSSAKMMIKKEQIFMQSPLCQIIVSRMFCYGGCPSTPAVIVDI